MLPALCSELSAAAGVVENIQIYPLMPISCDFSNWATEYEKQKQCCVDLVGYVWWCEMYKILPVDIVASRSSVVMNNVSGLHYSVATVLESHDRAE